MCLEREFLCLYCNNHLKVIDPSYSLFLSGLQMENQRNLLSPNPVCEMNFLEFQDMNAVRANASLYLPDFLPIVPDVVMLVYNSGSLVV